MSKQIAFLFLGICFLCSCAWRGGRSLAKADKLTKQCGINNFIHVKDTLLKNGLWIYNEDATHIVNYKKGLKHGQEIIIDTNNGNKKVLNYRKGKLHGCYYSGGDGYFEICKYNKSKVKKSHGGLGWQ